MKATLLDAHEGREVRAGGRVILDAGAPIVWFVFPDAWHGVGRFHRADGTFTGWYTNLCTPLEVTGHRWASTDLFLDLWQPADGSPPSWLDEDEFRAAVRAALIDDALARHAVDERAAIDARVAAGTWPPLVTREMDLERARRLAATE